jgi:glutamate-1-semialdehyde 2,1-aminomutase
MKLSDKAIEGDGTLGQLAARWADENPRSAELSLRALRSLPAGVTHDVRRVDPFPLAVARAEGSRKWDLDGHELICYVLGHGSLLLGHGNAEVVAAIQAQARLFLHPGAGHELECAWAEAVISLVPSAERVRFTSSGTEAALLALRLARAFTGRPRIVKLAGHFHGWSDQVAFGADPPFSGPDTAGLPPGLVPDVEVVAANASAVQGALAKGDVAAVILEPSGAGWGRVPLPSGFLQELRRLTLESGTVLIFDEVVSGFRWSPGGVQQVAGVEPDLTVLGKILAGGMPGGAVGGRAELLDLLALPHGDARRVAHPGTHNAHPASAAAGVVTLRLVGSGDSQDRADRLASELRSELNAVLERNGVAGRVYGEASTFHLLLGHEGPPESAPLSVLKGGLGPRLSAELHCGMLLEGVHLFHGSGFLSTTHNERDIERTVAAFAATVPVLEAEGLLGDTVRG